MLAWANVKPSAFALFAFSCLASTAICASEFSAQIKTASIERQENWYVLTADVNYVLSPAAKEAIQSSIPLVWTLKIQLKQVRYFHNKTLANIHHSYKIRYHALLNNYSVTDTSRHTRKKYTSLAEALDALSRIRNLKVLPVAALRKNKLYEMRIKLEFDREQLPAPLRPVAYLNSEWDLSSDWYLWQLEK
jgi:hypothetical protein